MTSSAHHHLLLVPTIHGKLKPPAPKGTRGLSPRCHPNSSPTPSGAGPISIRYRDWSRYPGIDNASPATKPTRYPASGRPQASFRLATFGLRLPGPFDFCAGIGSHLTRLSEPRWKCTSPVRSLYHIMPAVEGSRSAISESRSATCGGSVASNDNMRPVICQ